MNSSVRFTDENIPAVGTTADLPPAAAVQQEAVRAELEKHIFDGPSKIKDRDAYNPVLASLRTTGKDEEKKPVTTIDGKAYYTWYSDRQVEPNQVQNKTESGFPSSHKYRENSEYQRIAASNSYMPGYTGFVRGMQHIRARTYGEATRRAVSIDYRENVCTSPIPSSPQNNIKIRQVEPKDSIVSKTLGRQYHIPGYTGFVPGSRHAYARSYGATTSEQLSQHAIKHPRPRTGHEPGFAQTMRAREMLQVSSNPLPGTTGVKTAPGKLIPAHLRYLKFFAM